MARTKKQTIDAASARKRQIQEDILNESLALSGKRENAKSSSCEATNQKSASVTSKSAGNADSFRESSVTQSSDSSGINKSSENSVDFPKAVICITDIYKSSPELLDSASVRVSKNFASPKSHGSLSLKPGYEENLKHSMCESMDMKSDMKSALSSGTAKSKASPEAFSDQSPKKNRKASPSSKGGGKHHGRRSPRSQSQAFAGAHTIETSLAESCPAQKVERPKINIFTDNLGVDLGKRVRSPRRLSEDMIALPIFSVRRTGSSPKDNLGLSRGQDSDIFAETSSKRPLANGSQPINLSGKNEKQSDSISSSFELNPSLSIATKEISVKKYKFQGKKGQSIVSKNLISERSPEKSLAPTSYEGSSNCDNHEPLSSEHKGRKNVEFLMSSICKDVIGEVASKNEYLFQRISKRSDHCNQNSDSKNKISKGDSLETSSSLDKETSETDSPNCQGSKKIKSGDNMQFLHEGTIPNTKEQPSSLLCAMLVGGTDVAQNYSQKKEKLKPDVPEMSNSDSESGNFKEDHPDVAGNNSQDVKSKSLQSHVIKTEGTGRDPFEKGDLQNYHEMSQTNEDCDENLKEDIKLKDRVKEEMNMQLCAKEDKENESLELSTQASPDPTSSFSNNDALQNLSDSSSQLKEEKDISDWKKVKLDLSSQLKKLNENILKLVDIDVEDEFMILPDKQDADDSTQNQTESSTETQLYSLISNLGLRLKEDNIKSPLTSQCDVDEIDQLIQACPKSRQQIISSSDKALWNKILERLKEEEKCGKAQSGSSLTSSGDCMMDTSEIKTSANECGSAVNLADGKKNEPENLSKQKDKSVSDILFSPGDTNAQCMYSASSSSLNGSLCELDVDAMTSAAALALKVPGFHLDKPLPSAGMSPPKIEIENMNEDPLKPMSDVTAKRPLQKALTCSDFSSTHEMKIFRRVSSSPQLFKIGQAPSPSSLMPSILHGDGEGTNKSKLGSKIPVPGSLVPPKAGKKSWRTPRVIMNPKPLKILLQLETCCPSKDIFVSSDLQKYLWMPSSRMIVTPAIREEIKRADETAKQAWEAKMLIMREDEDSFHKKDDEEVNQHFSKHEPDFDEVEGMLFMSFSSEIELKAHMHVERALEWDKDDTMLRISRAKVFEETKAVNGDMKEVKMKHLRGQHMRWKKYKRMYSKEVDTLFEAKEKGIPLDQISSLRKTSDVTKIKGWKHKSGLLRQVSWHAKEKKRTQCDMRSSDSFGFYGQSETSFEGNVCASVEFETGDVKTSLDEKKRDLSPRSRRRFNFSDRKAHRQLFKELKMDWEDRMIHRKLGGWSLKGNRPKAFSRAAIKRQNREMKNSFASPVTMTDVPDISTAEPDVDLSPGAGGTLTPRRRKLVYPLLTERLARNCLKTLETGDILRALRRKKKKRFKRDVLSHLPALTPMLAVVSHSPLSQTFSSPSISMGKEGWSSSQELMTSTPSVTTPLNLDLPDETVLEGVDIASRISSPSVTDVQSSPQVKACSKPGCRYGCICHLCSASESPTPPESSLSKSSVPACDKEYCRLGCICDSLDPELPAPTQSHCGKPSCMLECVCSDLGQVDGSDDIPFLPSMKQRPRAGERFSNLPRREKTHRSAKNLDAVTRKALMLYETSEIYCEKVERARKRESSNSPKNAAKTEYPLEISPQPDLVLIETEDPVKCERPILQTAVSASIFSVASNEIPVHKKKIVNAPDVEITDVVQVLPVMEPSAHKRKRKSHPLSSEIFTFSSCARIKPYVSKKSKVPKLTSAQPVTSSLFLTGSSNFSNSQEQKMESFQKRAGAENIKIPESQSDLKIFNVTSLAPNVVSRQQDEKVISDFVDLTVSKDSKLERCSEQSGKPPTRLIPLSKIQESGKRASVCRRGSVVEDKSHHGWHSSMVCLKAKAPSKSECQSEDDVQEEDEVKLLEFAADCNWDGSKRAILAQVAGCLTRGHYPQPRTMNIGEFVVEILPKAQQPTIIPPELRAKLPEQMYSIRVRITRRDDPSKIKLLSPSTVSEPVIDLSVPSPTRKDQCATSTPGIALSSHLMCTESSSLQTSSSPSSSIDINPLLSPPLSSPPSHIGISGLSHVCVTSSSKPSSKPPVKSNSAPGSRRSSSEMLKQDHKLHSVDEASSAGASVHVKSPPPYSFPHSGAKNVTVKATGRPVSHSEIKSPTGSNPVKCRIQSSSSLLTTSPNAQKNFSPLVQPVRLLSPSSSLLKRATVVSGSKSKLFQPFTSATTNAANPVLKAVNSKDIKYVQLPNQEPLMVYEVDIKTDKKTLIAVPLSLASKSGDIKGKPILTVPVPTVGQQKVLPLLASRPKVTDESSPQILKVKAASVTSQPLFVKIPHVNPHVNPPIIVSSEQTSKPHGVLQLVPVQSTSIRPVNISKPIPASSKPPKPLGKLVTSGANEDKRQSSSSETAPTTTGDTKLHTMTQDPSHFTTVTQSRDRPISSSEVSPVKKDSHGVDDSPSQSALCSNSTSASLSETENFQEKLHTKDGSSSELTNPAIHIASKESSQVSNYEMADEESGIKILSTHSLRHNTEGLDQPDNKKSSEKEITSSVNQAFSPVTEKSTCASGLFQAGPCLPASSSSPSGPICDDESFNGFSVVKDISYPVISSQNETTVRLTTASTSDLVDQSADHGSHKEKIKERAVVNTIPLSCISLHNVGLVASNSNSPNNSQSTTQSVTENVLVASAKASKRSAEDLIGDDDHSMPEAKRSRPTGDGLPSGEDDINCLSNARPQSSCSRPKSGLSSVLSSASSEDQIINLSSDEEIDVGDNTPVDAYSSFKDQVEKAWENDHSSMYCKRPNSVPMGSSKGDFHKYLERARRARLKELFTQLADVVMSIPEMKVHLQKVTDVSTMPKAMILDSARKSMIHLTEEMNSGNAEINRLMYKNAHLKKDLQNVKAELLKRNMSGRAIAAIVNRAARQARKRQESTAHHSCEAADEVDGGCSQNDEPVNLVSPSTDGEEELEVDQQEDINRERTGHELDDLDEGSGIQSQEDIDMDIDIGKHEEVCEGSSVPNDEGTNFKSGVSHNEDITKESAVLKCGDASDENPLVSYEDISDWESSNCTNQEPVVQYEDITDEEDGS